MLSLTFLSRCSDSLIDPTSTDISLDRYSGTRKQLDSLDHQDCLGGIWELLLNILEQHITWNINLEDGFQLNSGAA